MPRPSERNQIDDARREPGSHKALRKQRRANSRRRKEKESRRKDSVPIAWIFMPRAQRSQFRSAYKTLRASQKVCNTEDTSTYLGCMDTVFASLCWGTDNVERNERAARPRDWENVKGMNGAAHWRATGRELLGTTPWQELKGTTEEGARVREEAPKKYVS